MHVAAIQAVTSSGYYRGKFALIKQRLPRFSPERRLDQESQKMQHRKRLLLPALAAWPSLALVILTALYPDSVTSGEGLAEKVVFAINAGGDAHVDVFGIRYSKDPSVKIGTASDYGKQLMIGRVSQQDQILYQTERYHTATFGYDIPVYEDGWYLLVLKFSEVYFNAPNMKVSATTISV